MTGTGRDLRRAYSKLGLEPSADKASVRQRYRDLAKRWHPDRYAADPQGQAEAAAQMREINAAYREVIAHVRTSVGGGRPDARVARGRLSREEIDGYVRAIGRTGPLDMLMDSGRGLGFRAAGFIVIMCMLASVHAARWLDWSPDAGLFLGLAFAVVIVVLLRRPVD